MFKYRLVSEYTAEREKRLLFNVKTTGIVDSSQRRETSFAGSTQTTGSIKTICATVLLCSQLGQRLMWRRVERTSTSTAIGYISRFADISSLSERL